MALAYRTILRYSTSWLGSAQLLEIHDMAITTAANLATQISEERAQESRWATEARREWIIERTGILLARGWDPELAGGEAEREADSYGPLA